MEEITEHVNTKENIRKRKLIMNSDNGLYADTEFSCSTSSAPNHWPIRFGGIYCTKTGSNLLALIVLELEEHWLNINGLAGEMNSGVARCTITAACAGMPRVAIWQSPNYFRNYFMVDWQLIIFFFFPPTRYFWWLWKVDSSFPLFFPRVAVQSNIGI